MATVQVVATDSAGNTAQTTLSYTVSTPTTGDSALPASVPFAVTS